MNNMIVHKILEIAMKATHKYIRRIPFLKPYEDDFISEISARLLEKCQCMGINHCSDEDIKLFWAIAHNTLRYYHSEQMSNLDLGSAPSQNERPNDSLDSCPSSPEFNPEEAYFLKETIESCNEDELFFIKGRLEGKSDSEMRKEKKWQQSELEEKKAAA